jgi:putative ABC transport system substrate-binding protein
LPYLEAPLRMGLSEMGYVEGRNLAALEYRYAQNQLERLPELAADLIRRRVDVIVTLGSDAVAAAAKAATTTIPIVFDIGGDPVVTKLVASLNRPGGREPQDREGARPHCAAVDSSARRRGDRMKRREFITGLTGAMAWPVAARARQGDHVRRIGVLMGRDENDPVVKTMISAFTRALAELGWTDGRNVRTDLRWGGDINRIRALAQELVGLQPDIILTSTTSATLALQRETRTIPIVFAGVSDPVASGIVARLDRPGGNITGFATTEALLGGKWLELLLEIAPGLKRAAIMFNPDTAPASAYMPSFEAAARPLKVELIIAPVHGDVDIETAIITLGREPGGGVVVMPDIFMFAHRALIISAVARNKVPAATTISILVGS